MDKLIEKKQDHPADALAKALDRASELLGTLGNLYEPTTDSFSGGSTFVAHAVATASILVSDARGALDSLHHNCDLTLLDDPATSNSVIEVKFQKEFEDESTQPDSSIYGDNVEVSHVISETIDTEEEYMAKTYLELLRKLTAAEVFAAEQQALSLPGSSRELLPLLQSLREDIRKIHKVA